MHQQPQQRGSVDAEFHERCATCSSPHRLRRSGATTAPRAALAATRKDRPSTRRRRFQARAMVSAVVARRAPENRRLFAAAMRARRWRSELENPRRAGSARMQFARVGRRRDSHRVHRRPPWSARRSTLRQAAIVRRHARGQPGHIRKDEPRPSRARPQRRCPAIRIRGSPTSRAARFLAKAAGPSSLISSMRDCTPAGSVPPG